MSTNKNQISQSGKEKKVRVSFNPEITFRNLRNYFGASVKGHRLHEFFRMLERGCPENRTEQDGFITKLSEVFTNLWSISCGTLIADWDGYCKVLQEPCQGMELPDADLCPHFQTDSMLCQRHLHLRSRYQRLAEGHDDSFFYLDQEKALNYLVRITHLLASDEALQYRRVWLTKQLDELLSTSDEEILASWKREASNERA